MSRTEWVRDVQEAQSAVQSFNRIALFHQELTGYALDGCTRLILAETGPVEVFREDLVATVWAGLPLSALANVLRDHGLMIPGCDREGTVGGVILQCEDWRDRVLGMSFVLADGQLVHSGSRAVKSVAGFDLHKFLVGSRGSLAMPVMVTLRCYVRPPIMPDLGWMREEIDPLTKRLMLTTKRIYDPHSKFNPGIWGFM